MINIINEDNNKYDDIFNLVPNFDNYFKDIFEIRQSYKKIFDTNKHLQQIISFNIQPKIFVSQQIKQHYETLHRIQKFNIENNSIRNFQRIFSQYSEMAKMTNFFQQNDIFSIHQQIQSTIQTLPDEEYQSLQESAYQISPQLSENVVEIRNNTVEENSKISLKDIKKINILINIILFLFISPYKEYIKNDINFFIKTAHEDYFDIDLTGEAPAVIKTDTYLRAGRSKNAPLVLNQKLKTAQMVFWETRKKNWVKVSIFIDGETYTGWVEKSKVVRQ